MPEITLILNRRGEVSIVMPKGVSFNVPKNEMSDVKGRLIFDWRGLFLVEVANLNAGEGYSPRILTNWAMFSTYGTDIIRAFTLLLGEDVAKLICAELESNTFGTTEDDPKIEVTQKEIGYIVKKVDEQAAIHQVRRVVR